MRSLQQVRGLRSKREQRSPREWAEPSAGQIHEAKLTEATTVAGAFSNSNSRREINNGEPSGSEPSATRVTKQYLSPK